MKRIYLRLIDKEPLEKPDNELLENVRRYVEEIINIKWSQAPSFHAKGGYTIVGEVPEDLDLEKGLVKLREAGFLAVV